MEQPIRAVAINSVSEATKQYMDHRTRLVSNDGHLLEHDGAGSGAEIFVVQVQQPHP